MRGSIFTLIGLGVGAAMVPAILDVDVTGDATGETVLDLVTTLDPLIGLAFVTVAFGLLIALFSDSGF